MPTPPDHSKTAGLDYSNSGHKFMYFNGHKDMPLVFSNYINNSAGKAFDVQKVVNSSMDARKAKKLAN
jgi:hypothetical protein